MNTPALKGKGGNLRANSAGEVHRTKQRGGGGGGSLEESLEERERERIGALQKVRSNIYFGARR